MPGTVTGRLVVDLTRLSSFALEYAIKNATNAPPGATVQFNVQSGQFPPAGGVRYFRDFGQELSVDIHAPDAGTVNVWVQAFREGLYW